jgi:hypothetical protein
MFLGRTSSDVFAFSVKLQIVIASKTRNEFLISARFSPAQFVVEMNNRQDNAKLAPQLQQQPQQRNRINPAGNAHANAIPSPQQLLPTNKEEHAHGQ